MMHGQKNIKLAICYFTELLLDLPVHTMATYRGGAEV